MIISLHIPKTAGTTVGYILDYGVKRKVFYDYTQLRDDELVEDIDYLDRNKDFIRSRFDVIHGHFPYRKYADIFPEAKYVVCLRDPLARTLSQYHHIIQEADPGHWLFEVLNTGKMDFATFADLPHLKVAQSLFLEGREVEEYDHIFLTEYLAESIYQFQVNHGFSRNDPYMSFEGEASIPNTNPANARKIKKKEIPKNQLVKAKNILCEDYSLYSRALEKFKVQQKQGEKILSVK